MIGGRTAEFDTATVNGQRFLIMASVGVDGEVVRRLSTQRTGNINHLSYAKPVLQSFLRFSYPELIASDGNGNEIGRGSHIIVANLPEYGFRMPFAPMATPHDAALDVAIFSGRGVFATAWHALKMRLGFSVEGSVIRSRQTLVHISSADGEAANRAAAPIQFDGDPCGFCPAEISIQPAAMTCVVPGSFQPDSGELS